MGPIEQNIARQAIRAGLPMPDRIANSPELTQGLELYLHAFFDLDSERTHIFSPAPIPWTSIKDYAVCFEFDEHQTEDLFHFIRKMDAEHLKKVAEKLKKPT